VAPPVSFWPQPPVSIGRVAPENDPRLRGQEEYLREAELTWRRYRARSDRAEDERCDLCRAAFVDPDASEAHRRYAEQHPEVLTEGYVTTVDPLRSVYHAWICSDCFDDFADMLEWRVAEPG
jgi:hypothetical protein